MQYKESQKFNQWWLWLINLVVFAGVSVAGWSSWSNGGGIVEALIGPGVMALVMILLATLELRTVITEDGIEVKFWPFGRQRIFKSEIKRAEVRKYMPIREFGGWGYRIGPGGKAYNMQGNHGLQLEFMDGERLMIGTQRPEELETFIKGYLENNEALDDEMVSLKLKELRENKLER
ncbi:hypothetical protein [Neolewinella persica]|uniref:hypothetical protein n=1 Tax=Neolewinella persica TaxID=70998 RepID=UPI0003619126|nr:hypothetical protein [Neolewinella persica]